MKERLFNLFYFVENGSIIELGAVVHEHSGSDTEKKSFLQRRVSEDYSVSKRFPLPKAFDGLSADRYFSLMRLGRHLEVFEPVFVALSAPSQPFCCVTAIVDGRPEIDIETDHSPFSFTPHQGHPKVGFGIMPDYLDDYMTPAGFDAIRLMNDDYFNAIRFLYNNRFYVSCMKLLASFIDSIAFLEFGDTRGNFAKWLDGFAKLQKLEISPSQLWELRNSILHMSNLDSRKVLAGDEERIGFFVGHRTKRTFSDHQITYFNLFGLIQVIAEALSVWAESLNQDRNKLLLFIQRYDRVVSEARPAQVRGMNDEEILNQ